MSVKNIKFLFLFLTFSISFYACEYLNKNQPKENEVPVARVFKKYLYQSDLENLAVESETLKNAFINDWIRKQLFLQKAESNLHTDIIDIEKQVKEYRNTLVTYNYEKYLVRQNLNTEVADQLIKDYYERYKVQFNLKDNVFKPKYIKVSANDELKDSLVNWIQSEDPYFIEKFNNYAIQHAKNYCLGVDWFTLKEFVYELPFKEMPVEDLFEKEKIFVKELNNDLHLLYVIDFGLENEIAPLDYKKNEIISIILNKRKIDYVDQVKKQIYEEAVNKNEIEIYD